MNKNKWWLNGGRGSGRTIRLLCEIYENKIADLQHKVDTLQGFLDHDIEYDMDKQLAQAKEIIKDLLLMAQVEHLKERYESVEQAEQFLKEIEK